MPKESTIILYNSSTTGNAPSAGDLNLGELAVNTMDEKVFLKNLGGTVLSLSQTKDLSGNFARLDKVVYSLNGLTGTLSVTGTAKEIEVSGSFPNIVVGLRDSVTIDNLTVTGATFANRASFSSGITTSHLWVSGGATFGDAKFTTITTQIMNGYDLSPFILTNGGGDIYVYESGGGDIALDTTGIIYLGDLTNNANNRYITISDSTGSVDFLNLFDLVGVNYADFNNRATFSGGITASDLWVSRGATFNSRANFPSGLTTANLFVSGGATFNSRANFAAGLTTANLFVSGGATFGAAVSITDALAATGATFTYNMSLGTNKNLLKDATFKDFGEVFGYQVRKEINDVKVNNRYYVDLTRGNIFYLDLQGSDNSGVLGGFAVGSILPSIKVPSTAWATVTTTVGLTGATASTLNQQGTIAAGQFLFGPGITSAGCTAVSYNSGTGAIVLSKAAQATVSNAYTAFVQNNGEGFGMGPSPQTSVASTFPPARVHSFTLIVGATASGSITWQTGATHYGQIKWPSGTAPTLTTTSGKFDVFSFLSYDYGTSWLAFNAGQNF